MECTARVTRHSVGPDPRPVPRPRPLARRRSLFEKDKLLFAFLLGTRLATGAGALHPAHLRFLLTGGVAMGEPRLGNPCRDWITDRMWGEVCRAGQLEGGALGGLCEHVAGAPVLETLRVSGIVCII